MYDALANFEAICNYIRMYRVLGLSVHIPMYNSIVQRMCKLIAIILLHTHPRKILYVAMCDVLLSG